MPARSLPILVATGSANEAMIRDGSLVGRTGYGFSYVIEDTGAGGYPWVTSTSATQATSVGAIFRNNTDQMCSGQMCHGDPTAPIGPAYDATGSSWGTYIEYYRPWEDTGICAACHGQPPDGTAFPDTAGSHATHMSAPNGPGITDCSVCHAPLSAGVHNNGSASFASGTDVSGNGAIEVDETDVCDACHSPDGPYDGLAEARANWAAGTSVSCGGCHDNGTSTINGVDAPPIAGDDSTWGYYATGHGRNDGVACLDCHVASMIHTDGVAQTYQASADNYQAGFRLKSIGGSPPLEIPRVQPDAADPYDDPPLWELCLSCHDRYALFGGPTAPPGPYYSVQFRTNFRSDASVIIPDGLSTDIAGYSMTGAVDYNSHYDHVQGPPQFYDSDRDGLVDSYGSCVACHNVHGSTSAAMVRDGKLIGMEPALNFDYVRYDRHDSVAGCPDAIIMTSAGAISTAESHGGVMRSDSDPAANGVCNYCHAGGSATATAEYEINCFWGDAVDYYRQPVPIVLPPPTSP